MRDVLGRARPIFQTIHDVEGRSRSVQPATIRAIEAECEVTIGLMRPTDPMAILFEPPPTKNPLRWMEYQVHGGDTDFALSRQLTQCLKKRGRLNDWRDRVKTLDDFVRAWCGGPPTTAAATVT